MIEENELQMAAAEQDEAFHNQLADLTNMVQLSASIPRAILDPHHPLPFELGSFLDIHCAHTPKPNITCMMCPDLNENRLQVQNRGHDAHLYLFLFSYAFLPIPCNLI